MPPTNEEQMVVQYDLLMHEAKRQILEAEALLGSAGAEGGQSKRMLSEREREKLADVIGRELTAEEGAKLRFFFNHLPESDWDAFRKAATLHEDSPALEQIIAHYHAFCAEFDAQVANMDPEAVTLLTELCESQHKPATELLEPEDDARREANAQIRESIQRITESLVKMVRDERIGE